MTSAAEAILQRTEPGLALADEADRIARAAHAMAQRFSRGGKLIVFGAGAAVTDAEHIAVEFLHPVIVGKQALPAVSLAADVATVTGLVERESLEEMFSHQIRYLGEPGDIALGVAPTGVEEAVRRGLEVARERGMLTVALLGRAGNPTFADHALVARSDDPLIVKEMHVWLYHVLWELVHVFFEHPGLLEPAVPAACAVAADGISSDDATCITCSDAAIEVLVIALRPGDLALVDTGESEEEISVALVEARVGSRVLVHAKEAIALLSDGELAP